MHAPPDARMRYNQAAAGWWPVVLALVVRAGEGTRTSTVSYYNCVLIKKPSVTIRTQDSPRSISYCVFYHPCIEVGVIDACV